MTSIVKPVSKRRSSQGRLLRYWTRSSTAPSSLRLLCVPSRVMSSGAAVAFGSCGGARVIYYWDKPTQTFYMLYAYTKQEQGDLSQQVKVLRRLVREEFK